MSKEEQTKMDQITTEMAEYFCDKLCRHSCRTDITQEELEDICCGCEMGRFVCDILNTYDNLNDFEKSQSCKLLQTISELRKQLPAFKVGDTAYIVDFDEGVVNKSIVNRIKGDITGTSTYHEYKSDLLDFCNDDIGVIVFQTDAEAEQTLAEVKGV